MDKYNFKDWLRMSEADAASGTPQKAGELDKEVANAAATATGQITSKAASGTNPADVIQDKQSDILKATVKGLSTQGIKAPIGDVAAAIKPKMSKKK